MSALSGAYSLPPEVWAEIFECATYVPGLMDIDVADPFDTPTSTTPFDPWSETELRASLRCRLSLSMVCKHWRSVALPILYRCLVLRDENAADVLTEMLKTSEESAGESGGVAVGSWVRHLIVEIPRRYDLAPLARYLPCVEILTAPNLERVTSPTHDFSFSGAAPPIAIPALPVKDTFLHTLARTAGASLLRLSVGAFPAPRDDPAFLLSAAPRLRTLLCSDASLCPLDLPRAPRLQFVSVDGSSRDVPAAPDAPFPAVRHACVRNPGFYRERDGWRRFLEIQGPHLTTLHIDFSAAAFNAFARSRAHVVSEACPDLVRLVIYLVRLPVPFALGGAPSVPCLAVHFKETLQESYGKILVQALLEIDCSTPRVVRFLNVEASTILRKHLETESDGRLGAAVAGNLRLQDHMGEPLRPVLA